MYLFDRCVSDIMETKNNQTAIEKIQQYFHSDFITDEGTSTITAFDYARWHEEEVGFRDVGDTGASVK